MGGQKITGLGAPTSANDAVTKAYADSLTVGGSSSTSVTSADGTKKVLADNIAIQFQEGGVTHLSVNAGVLKTTTGNLDITTTSNAVSNRLLFKSLGEPNQSQFYALNFNDGAD